MEPKLLERHAGILEILISDYIASAEPVGSRTIAKKYAGHLSPATIRNVLSDLTEMGFLTQPHTSAGRVPTGAGMRYFVDTLLKKRELSDAEMEAIRECCAGDEREVMSIIQNTSKLLAQVSHYVGLVMTPSTEEMIFKQIQFMPLSKNKVLGIFVSRDGIVQNRLIETGEDFNFSEIDKISNYCNNSFHGMTLEDALDKIERELATDYAKYDKMLRHAMLFSREVLSCIPGSELVVGGEIQLLDTPEFSNSEEFRRVVRELEEKNKVVKLLERCREGQGVRIFIGSDSPEGRGLDLVGIVGAPYKREGRTVGTLGVIGPMRMDYSRVVPIVDFTAKVLGDILDA
ncbi:MAG TPA: heat-inducible transcriptional repressor HrcA [bacterium]|nr:heat-inducible transcription repressor HrcA [Myxococcales bacterium]OQA61038.1 MAG: Heat-inducible transcription repressor HrcA [bacterium ADurb.Bin270]HPW44926.1 heat-inducible transcriptional repressor HrcA [bacterium]HQC50706.1 heat-inducible transcriptional repressor HrcA [bacterium]HQG12776.1 heat-inducible transcriptional repressor HrcA [bacterium]